jgi:hypothetical protein
MTLRTIWAVIARWKWIIIPGLILGLAGGAAAFLKTPKTYSVEASYLFLSPVKDVKGIASNPFLQLGNGVSQAVDVLAVSLVDGKTVRQFTDRAPQLKYTAGRDISVGAPLMAIMVQDVNLDTARSTLTSLGGILQTRLDSLQSSAGAPRGQWITMTELTNDPKPKIGYSDGIRNGVLAFVGILLLTLIIVAIAERVRVRRQGKRDRRAAEALAEAQENGEPESSHLAAPKRKKAKYKAVRERPAELPPEPVDDPIEPVEDDSRGTTHPVAGDQEQSEEFTKVLASEHLSEIRG